MPLIRPEIQQILNETGLARKADNSLSDRLDAKGLSLDRTLEDLSAIADAAQSDYLKKWAIETSLKLHGVLRESAPSIPAITISIIDPYGATLATNPILLPRSLQVKETVQ